MRVKVLSFSALPQSFALEQCFDLFYFIFCWTFLEFRNWNAPKNVKTASRTDRKPSVSLRSWRYCVGARLKFWWRSRVPKKGSGTRWFVFLAASPLVTAPPSNLTRLYYNGSAAKSHSTTTQYRQLRRLTVRFHTASVGVKFL